MMIGNFPGSTGGGHRLRRHRQPAANRRTFSPVNHTIEPMWGAAQGAVIRACRQHLQIGIKLHRICIDDDTIRPFGKRLAPAPICPRRWVRQ
jgi:hypothetical protein